MKIKTNELSGRALDWAVAKCENRDLLNIYGGTQMAFCPHYSADWFDGGQIIERERICIYFTDDGEYSAAAIWKAAFGGGQLIAKSNKCQTPLIAAMRCYVASKLGDEVEVPEELS